MKKILFLLFFLNILLNCVIVRAETGDSCAGGAGTMIGSKVCVSNVTMNWWSAFNWCEKIARGHLGSVYELCGSLQKKGPCGSSSSLCEDGYIGSYVTSAEKKLSYGGWTSTYDPSQPSSTVHTIRFDNGDVYPAASPKAGHYGCSFNNSYTGKAICVIN